MTTATIPRDVAAHRLGLALVLASAVIWSTAGLFAKGITADVWAILFWRGIFSGLGIMAYMAWRKGKAFATDFARLGMPGWLLATIGAAATVCFIAAFKNTSIANVAIIYAAVPFVAAAMAWVLMRERASRSTLAAAALALVGVIIMVGSSAGTPNLTGDLLALGMVIGMAYVIVLTRQYPGRPMVAANCVSALLLIAVGWVFGTPFDVPLSDFPGLIGFGIMFASAVILLTEGARLIPTAQTGLIGTFEAPLAPVWAWLLLSELPPAATFIGGTVVFAAVGWETLQSFRQNTPG